MLLYYRARDVEGDRELKGTGAALSERALHRFYALAAGNPGLWKVLGTTLRWAANLNEQDGKISRMVGPVSGWFQVRDLPAFPNGGIVAEDEKYELKSARVDVTSATCRSEWPTFEMRSVFRDDSPTLTGPN